MKMYDKNIKKEHDRKKIEMVYAETGVSSFNN